MPNTASPSDRFIDFSLRLLTIFVLAALVASAAFLAYRWIAPRFESRDAARLQSRSAPAAIRSAPSLAGPSVGDEVLMDPHRVFRCDERGRVSFSDKACAEGGPSNNAAAQPKPDSPQ
jgi:hypothetical protein